jgi:hypothetical protein
MTSAMLPHKRCRSDGRLVAIKEMRMECCDWEQVTVASRCPCNLPYACTCFNYYVTVLCRSSSCPRHLFSLLSPNQQKWSAHSKAMRHPDEPRLLSLCPCLLINPSPAVIKEQSRVLIVFPLCECNLLHLLQQVPQAQSFLPPTSPLFSTRTAARGSTSASCAPSCSCIPRCFRLASPSRHAPA